MFYYIKCGNQIDIRKLMCRFIFYIFPPNSPKDYFIHFSFPKKYFFLKKNLYDISLGVLSDQEVMTLFNGPFLFNWVNTSWTYSSQRCNLKIINGINFANFLEGPWEGGITPFAPSNNHYLYNSPPLMQSNR